MSAHDPVVGAGVPVWPLPPSGRHRRPDGPSVSAPPAAPAPAVASVPVPEPVPELVPASGLVSRSVALCRAVVAALLVALVGLVLLSVAPRIAGWEGHVVVSGSMEPRLAPGDVVLTHAVSPAELQPGQVLLFADPERPDRTLLHRLVSFDERGDLVTRGDANQSNDSVHVSPASVIGHAQVRIPFVGLPAYWRVQGEWGHIALAAGLLAAATLFATRGDRGWSPSGTGTDAAASSPADRHTGRRSPGRRAAHRAGRGAHGHRAGRRAGQPAGHRA